MDLLDHIPHHRDRLILVAKNARDEELFNHRPTPWPVAPKPTLNSYGALLVLGGYWKAQSELTRDEILMYLDPKFAPQGGSGTQAKKARKDVAQMRLKSGDDTVACILTSYGRPSAVQDDALARSGLYGSLIQKGNEVRRLVVPEVVILFGAIQPCWLPAQIDVAMTIMGNAIAIPHALIGLLNAVSYLRPLWHGDNIQLTFASVCSEHLSKDNIAIFAEDEGFWFCKADHEDDGCDPTENLRNVRTLTVTSPLQEFQLWVEEGICIRRLLQHMVGVSMPPQLDL